MPKLQVITLGCSKNTVDTEHLLFQVQDSYEIVPEGETCPVDVLLINTCGFIGDAKEQSIQTILAAAKRKAEGEVGRLLVFGCLSQRYPDELPGLIPEVDGWYGARELDPLIKALGCKPRPELRHGRLIEGESSLVPLALRRRKAYAIQSELSFDDIYIGKPVADSFDIGPESGQLRGVPVSNGECEGIVHIVNSADDANQLKKGEIMVAKFTDIGWTPYYSIVNGLITEIGSSLSHGAVVAREYGLPTIVNVKGATKILKNGDHIVMNAYKGTILCS